MHDLRVFAHAVPCLGRGPARRRTRLRGRRRQGRVRREHSDSVRGGARVSGFTRPPRRCVQRVGGRAARAPPLATARICPWPSGGRPGWRRRRSGGVARANQHPGTRRERDLGRRVLLSVGPSRDRVEVEAPRLPGAVPRTHACVPRELGGGGSSRAAAAARGPSACASRSRHVRCPTDVRCPRWGGTMTTTRGRPRTSPMACIRRRPPRHAAARRARPRRRRVRHQRLVCGRRGGPRRRGRPLADAGCAPRPRRSCARRCRCAARRARAFPCCTSSARSRARPATPLSARTRRRARHAAPLLRLRADRRGLEGTKRALPATPARASARQSCFCARRAALAGAAKRSNPPGDRRRGRRSAVRGATTAFRRHVPRRRRRAADGACCARHRAPSAARAARPTRQCSRLSARAQNGARAGVTPRSPAPRARRASAARAQRQRGRHAPGRPELQAGLAPHRPTATPRATPSPTNGAGRRRLVVVDCRSRRGDGQAGET